MLVVASETRQSRIDSRLRGNDVIPAKAGIASSLMLLAMTKGNNEGNLCGK
ncbi:MAG: hypothetical protein QME64_06145 [bacterium]|nr:hypothetical protein [bacterium]